LEIKGGRAEVSSDPACQNSVCGSVSIRHVDDASLKCQQSIVVHNQNRGESGGESRGDGSRESSGESTDKSNSKSRSEGRHGSRHQSRGKGRGGE
jgi:hypothetical protein